jgi:hypothetical protein
VSGSSSPFRAAGGHESTASRPRPRGIFQRFKILTTEHDATKGEDESGLSRIKDGAARLRPDGSGLAATGGDVYEFVRPFGAVVQLSNTARSAERLPGFSIVRR